MADENVVVKKSFLKKLIDKGKAAPTVIIEKARSGGRRAVHLAKNPREAVGLAWHEAKTDANGIFTLMIGAGTGLLINTDTFKKNDWLKRNWYALPLAMIALGYYLVRKRYPYGKALMTLGGLLFVQAYQNRPKKEPDKKESDKKTTDDPTWDETSRPLVAAPPGSRWVVTADGQQMLVPVRDERQLPQKRRESDHIARTADEIYGRRA